MNSDLTNDDFLGGKIRAYQPRNGYRAGVDPVLLAASTPAKPGQTVLELGCGVGVASLCLAARVPELDITGVELQPDYAELAERNAAQNNAPFTVVNADLRALPPDIRQKRFHHVIMNPPYFDREAGVPAQDSGRDIAMGGDTPLRDWIEIGARRVGPRGYMTVIQRMERLPDVLSALEGRLGAVIVRPISGREGRAPELFLLQARQEGRAAFRMSAPIIMHHDQPLNGDKDSYNAQIRDVLRNGAAFPISP
ncbi:tRNA1(Val) (adenine(37)-N6)-methyltransferase [Loktanella sp. S4079]|uniref:tRNA1(Val) (adenine(37)-N6)-methyltransferase n=1 Tax=Loktanella sp. S4079 TaxID=579483 RepID=UPI0005F9F060|nr:methyltransferase [Loktanella sp. S4079]KJZ19143.1 methyltransferase [Loktanella sp. S4079]